MTEIRSKEISMVPLKDVVLNPKNRNKHPAEQIDRLVELIKYQGFRNPVTVSNRTGLLIAGEGRFLAASKLGMTEIPVIYQDFESEEVEYAYGVSDNAVASWADLDLSGINFDLQDLGPDFDIDLLGIKNFTLDTRPLPPPPQTEKPIYMQITFTLHNDQGDVVSRALSVADGMGQYGDTGNENSNGNALARVCELFLAQHGQC